MVKTIYNADKIVSVHYIKPEVANNFTYDEINDKYIDDDGINRLFKVNEKININALKINYSYKKDDFGIDKKFDNYIKDNQVYTLPKVKVYFDNSESYTMKFDDEKEAYLYYNKMISHIPINKQIEVEF